MDYRKEASDCRALAARARRMALGLSLAADRTQVNRYADELEKRAAELDAQAAGPTAVPLASGPAVTHQQQQVQQQHSADPKSDPKKTDP